MNTKELQQNGEIEIDLRRVFEAVWNKMWLVLTTAVAGAVVSLLITVFAITPTYESAAMFYVNNNSLSVGDASFSISSGDLTTSRNLVKSYIVILNTRESLNDVIDYAGVNRSVAEVKRMISASSVDETEIFEVVVTSPDPEEAESIANAVAYILPKRISSIIEGTSAKVVDSAVRPSKPTSPSYTNNTIIGFILGFVMSMGVIVLREIFDITIRDEEDITQCCPHPILVSVPDMTVQGKGGYYGYGVKGSPEKKASASGRKAQKQPALIGEKISFASSEAYKLLRTKLQFSFVDDSTSHVIGISSAMSGEGKSLTAINLAYTMSQLNKRIVVVDCDMRRPTLAEKLNIRKKPGLSSYLTGQINADELLQYCGIENDEKAFHVIAAGECPPNPIELLSSARMEKVLRMLRTRYDYIILDLPPVGEVSDALSIAGKVDGMLLVVRQNYCNRIVLSDALHQFQFVNARILGVVHNCANEHGGSYGKSRYYTGYYRKYGPYKQADNK